MKRKPSSFALFFHEPLRHKRQLDVVRCSRLGHSFLLARVPSENSKADDSCCVRLTRLLESTPPLH